MKYIVYNNAGRILRTGKCQDKDISLQAGDSEFVIEGKANDVTQKVVGGRVVDKTPGEIEVDNPPIPKLPLEKQIACITNEQWQNVLVRLDKLEIR